MEIEWLTTAQAARKLNISPRRVLYLIQSERLPATKFGRDWMIRSDDLKLVKERKHGYPKGRPRKP